MRRYQQLLVCYTLSSNYIWGINVHHNEKYILWEDINSLPSCQAIILYMYEHLTHRDSMINKVSAL